MRKRSVYCVSLLLLLACSKESKPTQDETSLTIPQELWQQSKFCGDVRPPLPENPTPPHIFDRDFLDAQLSDADGLLGWMHGVVTSYKQYVFTYRKEDPNDFMAFFKAEQFALVPANTEVETKLAGLKRHDKVRLKGAYFKNASPLPHLMINSVDVVKAYEHATSNTYNLDLEKLKGKSRFSLFGMVHNTIASEQFGRALVIESKDMILPLAVPAKFNAIAAELFRGDIVNIAVKMSERPHGPPHLEVDPEIEQAIEIVDPILNCHDKEATVTGFLTKFNKSPAISVDVYAIRVVDANGQGRNFTLFPDTEDNDEFTKIFTELSAKAKAAWDGSSQEAEVVRNYWMKNQIKVSAKGRINVVSSEQANAQVYIKSIEDLTF